MSCDCFDKVNGLLKPHGAVLNFNLFDKTPRAFVVVIASTEKRKRGRKIPLMQATFCPFCGTKYPKETDRTVTEQTSATPAAAT